MSEPTDSDRKLAKKLRILAEEPDTWSALTLRCFLRDAADALEARNPLPSTPPVCEGQTMLEDFL